jgi:NSS family neurotransmitter:Na+ symporter
VGRALPRNTVIEESGMGSGILFKSWWFVLRYFAPVGIILVFLNSLKLI